MAERKKREKDNKKFFPRRRRRRPCLFCVQKMGADYKDIDLMRKFITDRGKIAPRRSSGCCAKHQRMISKEIKKARQVGMVPYVLD